MNAKDYACMALILAMIGMGAYFYPHLPDKIADHWNEAGQANGYSSKIVGVIMMPLLTAGIYGFFLLIPKIEVFKENIKAFIGYYDNIKLLMVLFMAGIYAATLLQNAGYSFNITFVIIPAVAVLFYYIGQVMPHMKRNFFVGIRTPWTLANEKVWNATHLMGGKTFRLNAIVLLLAVAAPGYAAPVILVSVLANALFLTIYSYWLYQREGKNQLA
jgi:uncharacterized membrane protein